MTLTAAPAQAKVFAWTFFAYYAYVGIFAPYASLYFFDLGMSVVEIGILMSLMQVTRIFGPYFWSWVAECKGQKVLVLRYTALAAVVCLLGFFGSSLFIHFFFLMLLLNFFTSSQVPLAEAIMLSEMRGDLTFYGRLRLWGSVGFIAAVMLGGLFFDVFGVRRFPWLAFCLMILVYGVSQQLREPAETHAAPLKESGWQIMRKPEVLAFFVSTCLMIAAHSALYVYYSLYLEGIGYSKALIGGMWSIGVVAEIVFFYYQAPLFRRFGARRLMMVSLFCGILRFLLIALGAGSLWLLLLAQLLHAATFGAHHSASVITMQRWFHGPLQARGQAFFISISYGLGGTLGGLVLSVGWERVSPQSVYWLAMGMVLLALVAALVSYRWQGRVGTQ